MEAMGQLTGGALLRFQHPVDGRPKGLTCSTATDDPARRERLKAGIRQAIDRGRQAHPALLTSRVNRRLASVISERTIRGMRDLRPIAAKISRSR
jgi:hypothetical protein